MYEISMSANIHINALEREDVQVNYWKNENRYTVTIAGTTFYLKGEDWKTFTKSISKACNDPRVIDM